MGHQPLPNIQALDLLQLLENEQEADEKNPVGGHGAGLAYLNKKGHITLMKVGGAIDSPADHLRQQMKATSKSWSHLILGHVRRASPEFDKTIPYTECTQPFKPACTATAGFTILSVHNGYLQNYQQLKNQLTQKHRLESAKYTLIDSEVIAHLYEEQLAQTKDSTEAANSLHQQIEGNNTIVLVTTNGKEAHLHTIHKGKTRGLTVWTNPEGEVLLCSRENPVQRILQRFLKENNHRKIIAIQHTDVANMQADFNIKLQPQTETKTKKNQPT